MDPVHRLISGFLDDELSREEAAQLAAALESDGATVDRLVFQSFLHAQMLEWMDHQAGQERVPSPAERENTSRSLPGSTRVNYTRTASRFWARPALAAAILVAAGMVALAYFLMTRPTVVGQLTQATGCRWASPRQVISVGTLLKEGDELELEQGVALITFVSGAQLRLEGPTSLRLESAKGAHLLHGQIAAKVPTTARGFMITSTLARFIDLGTEFTLQLVAEESFELHVFEGLVELQLDERFGDAARQPVRVAEVRAVTFDTDSGEVAVKQFQVGKQMPF
jgi:ferric-dicitrate binding protein FerR (iron transport regulator)